MHRPIEMRIEASETRINSQPAARNLRHLQVLDGWRALSITLVLAGHLLPLGPKNWHINGMIAPTGMVIFFTLSGFLITRFLIKDGNVRNFLIRRVLRIVPLAWVGMTLALVLGGGTALQFAGNLFFYANLPPIFLLPAGGHFWSLCLEVQFYAMIALLVAVGRQPALMILPIACVAVTGVRIAHGNLADIVTLFRIDELLAGCILALIYEGKLGRSDLFRWAKNPIFIFVIFPAILFSNSPWGGPVNYARPYLSAWMIGASLYSAPAWMRALSAWRPTVYVAQTSYALYVFHGVYMASWLGSGDTLVKYAKRPLLFAVTWACAHFSTFYYERYWINLSHQLTKRQPDTGAADYSAMPSKL